MAVRLKKLGAWFYPRSSTLEELKTIADRTKQELDLDYLVISVPGRQLAKELKNNNNNNNTPSCFRSTTEMVKMFKRNNIDVVLMTLQDPRFGSIKELGNALEIVRAVLAVCKETGCSEIHFDIEPHTLPEWKKKDEEKEEDTRERRKKILEELSEVLKEITKAVTDFNQNALGGGLHLTSEPTPSSSALSSSIGETEGHPATAALLHLPDPTSSISEAELELLPPTRIVTSLAIPWWMGIRFPEITKGFSVDCLYLMCYGGCGSTIDEVLEKMVKKQRPFLRPTVIGIGVEDMKKEEGKKEKLEGKDTDTCGCLRRVAQTVDERLLAEEDPSYLSPCLYSLNHLLGVQLKNDCNKD